MNCPHCNSSKHIVLQSRTPKQLSYIQRRRECSDCKGRWTTKEFIVGSLDSIADVEKNKEKLERRRG